MIYFPYDNKSANVQDRNVNSTQFASFIYKLCGYKSGIFETLGNKGVVKVKNGMTVTVAPLDGAIQGRLFDEVAVRELQLDTGGELDRIDTVVVRANLNDRTTDLYVLKGVEASLPTRPALKRSGGIYEIGLADIYIPKLTTTITDSRITDTRIDTNRMAILPVINSVDTSAIFNQYQSALDEYLALVETALDGTTAGHLQNQIGTLVDLITESKTNVVEAVNENARNVEKNSADIEENKPQLLWTNRSPTSNFAEQTVNLPNLGQFMWILVTARVTTQSDLNIQEQFTNVFSLSSGTKFSLSKARFVNAQSAENRASNVYREMVVGGDSLRFGPGLRTIIKSGSYSTTNDDNAAVPFAIFGIK